MSHAAFTRTTEKLLPVSTLGLWLQRGLIQVSLQASFFTLDTVCPLQAAGGTPQLLLKVSPCPSPTQSHCLACAQLSTHLQTPAPPSDQLLGDTLGIPHKSFSQDTLVTSPRCPSLTCSPLSPGIKIAQPGPQIAAQTCPATWVTFQGDRLKEAKLLQDLDKKNQDHEYGHHLQPFQGHGCPGA